jgi:hypothetical protein
MIGFNSTGYLTTQTLSSNGIFATSKTSGVLSLNTWTHVSMTYSTRNGIRLFVNGSLANSNNNTYHNYLASGEMCTIVIGTGLWPTACNINQTKIVPSQFRGMIDDLKIFSRELSQTEISQIMASP